jgi:hypothetical protein
MCVFIYFMWYPMVSSRHNTKLSNLNENKIIITNFLNHSLIILSREFIYFISSYYLNIGIMCLKHIWNTYKCKILLWMNFFHSIYVHFIHLLNKIIYVWTIWINEKHISHKYCYQIMTQEIYDNNSQHKNSQYQNEIKDI